MGSYQMRAHVPDTPDLSPGGLLIIDLSAIRANYRHLSHLVRPAVSGGVVKANAYGLGAGHVAPLLYDEGCRHFFVAHLSEALALRPLIPADAEIYVLNGLGPGSEPAAAAARVHPVLNSIAQIKAWGALASVRGETLPAALQVDTGMSRLGLSAAEVSELLASPNLLDGIEPALLMSHLACADERDNVANQEQLTVFQSLAEKLPGARRSFANSGGIFLGSAYQFDVARPGVALYGVTPIDGGDVAMTPVVRLDARVIQIREIPPGAGIGYGLTHRSTGPMRLATLAIGYADGWHRCLSGRGSAYFNGVRLPIVGRVSMDSMTVDVGGLAPGDLGPGDYIELIGPHQTLAHVAADAGTIPYEILTSLGQRYRRIYVDGDSRPSPSMDAL